MLLNNKVKQEDGSVKKCLITGASGFIGSALLESAFIKPFITVPVYRKSDSNVVCVPDINKDTNWSFLLENIDVVIHAAARVHIMSETHQDSLTEFRKVNVDGTLNLARQSARAGVNRFIFISSIKVNGETTSGSLPFTEQLSPEPQDPYGISKNEAEDGLRSIAEETGMDVVIIRPPLVYGSNVKANFLSLLKLADTVLPLPFAAIHNKRSMVYIGNLVDFVVRCIDHPAAANQTFLISDGHDLSLKGLLRMMRTALGRPVRLLSVPSVLFRMAGRLTGKSAVVDRLIGNLQVDSSKARELLGWAPPFTVQQGINATIAAHLEGKKCEGKKSENEK